MDSKIGVFPTREITQEDLAPLKAAKFKLRMDVTESLSGIDAMVGQVWRGLLQQEEAFVRQHLDLVGTHERLHYPERSREEGTCTVYEHTVCLAPIGTAQEGGLLEEEAKARFPWTTLSWSMSNPGRKDEA